MECSHLTCSPASCTGVGVWLLLPLVNLVLRKGAASGEAGSLASKTTANTSEVTATSGLLTMADILSYLGGPHPVSWASPLWTASGRHGETMGHPPIVIPRYAHHATTSLPLSDMYGARDGSAVGATPVRATQARFCQLACCASGTGTNGSRSPGGQLISKPTTGVELGVAYSGRDQPQSVFKHVTAIAARPHLGAKVLQPADTVMSQV